MLYDAASDTAPQIIVVWPLPAAAETPVGADEAVPVDCGGGLSPHDAMEMTRQRAKKRARAGQMVFVMPFIMPRIVVAPFTFGTALDMA